MQLHSVQLEVFFILLADGVFGLVRMSIKAASLSSCRVQVTGILPISFRDEAIL